jgi:three-Cys-motif partner protein
MLSGSPNYNKGKQQTFTYIDLFAGTGSFKNEEIGSPLLAFQIFKSYLTATGASKNSFAKIQLIAIEQNEENADKLRLSLADALESSGCQDRLEVKVETGNWEKQSSMIAKYLLESQWGFVFADPFSTELDIDKFI